LLVIDKLGASFFSARLPGALLYYALAFGLASVSIAACLAPIAWWKRLALVVLAAACFVMEILVLGIVALLLTGLNGIQ
jgi:hypothetical protein